MSSHPLRKYGNRVLHRMLPVVFILFVLIGLAFWYGPAKPPARGGISRLEQVELGGVRQWISIRGANPSAPVLLFLHGGPGSANLAKLRLQVPELEQHFVIVNWDQPGAGKSASPGFNYSTLSTERMISAAQELVAYLKARFGVEKIYLMGFSWGTVIGLSLVERSPQDFYAYIAVSQIVNAAEGERISLEYVRQAAQRAGDERALTELAGIDPAYRSQDWFHQITSERSWLLRYGGVYHTTTSYTHEIWMLLRSHEYSFADVAFWPSSSSASLKQLWPQEIGVNFFQSASSLGCPVYFFVGRYDYNVPAQLTAAYYQQLDAPAGKHLVWFENSAHDIFYDEPAPITAEILKVESEQHR